jgi:adenine-specific DNA-methyltransferase
MLTSVSSIERSAHLQLQLEIDNEATSDRDFRRRLGVVYTPEVLAEWVAAKLLEHMPAPDGHRPLILDPACGDGALLRAVARQSKGSCELAGFDVDKDALALVADRVSGLLTLRHVDALLDDVEVLLPRSPNGVIANPPWGADLSASREILGTNYELAAGQFDSYELFIERYLRIASPGAALAFIIPDSVFLPEHEAVRGLLLDRSELQVVARLGEGFFPGVFRGTAVLIFRKCQASPKHEVSCFRLPAPARRDVLTGSASLAEREAEMSHLAQQSRFAEHPRREFDIDVRPEDSRTMRKFSTETIPWTEWFEIGRGVELGKSGQVLVCPRCSTARPLPRNSHAPCQGCGVDLYRLNIQPTSIVASSEATPEAGTWVPLMIGEDVDRYRARASRQIQLGISGINYKDPDSFNGDRLLIRKTGVGLKAAIDSSGAYTTQVVFHFRPRPSAPDFALEYVQAFMCSRSLLAAHLRRSGEMEWRSHPYVTPTTICSLPIPDPGPEEGWRWRQAVAIAKAVRNRPTSAGPEHDSDLQIERLVAGLLDFDEQDCRWVLNVLDNAQGLKAIAPLRLADPAQMSPLKVT